MVNRVKPYDVPHKGLRAALSQLSLLAGNTDYDNRGDVKKLYLLGEDIFNLLEVHANDENTVTLAELEVKCPGSADHDLKDHGAIEKEQSGLRNALEKIYSDSQSGKVIRDNGDEFYLAFSEFHSTYLRHLSHEERVTQGLLWKNFTDEELASQRTKIMKDLSPETLLTWFKFVIPAQNRIENTVLLGGFKKMAPKPFFEQGMQVVKNVLPKEEFEELSAALSSE